MTNQHPITPPPELVQQWIDTWHQAKVKHVDIHVFVATQAARWGWRQRDASVANELQEARDEELEGCCKAIDAAAVIPLDSAEWLRAARRPAAIPETIEVDGHTYQLVK